MRYDTEKGFTLIEVLMSITIFAIGVLAIVNMQIMSTWTNARARGMTEGIVIAQNEVERLSALNYSNAELADTDGDGDTGLNDRVMFGSVWTGSPSGNQNPDGQNLSNPLYQVFWNVRDDHPFTGIKTIRVFVVWDSTQPKWFSMDMTKADGA